MATREPHRAVRLASSALRKLEELAAGTGRARLTHSALRASAIGHECRDLAWANAPDGSRDRHLSPRAVEAPWADLVDGERCVKDYCLRQLAARRGAEKWVFVCCQGHACHCCLGGRKCRPRQGLQPNCRACPA